MEYKQEIKSLYGSLKNAPKSVGPCQKIDPVIGTKNAFVLLAEFKDKKHSNEANAFKDLLFSKDNKQSLRNYYLETSWNQLDINGDVNEKWYALNNNRTDYLDDPTNLSGPGKSGVSTSAFGFAQRSMWRELGTRRASGRQSQHRIEQGFGAGPLRQPPQDVGEPAIEQQRGKTMHQ